MGKPAWGGGVGGCTPSPSKGAHPNPKSSLNSNAMGGGASEEGVISGPQYHNPDPLVRLIGTPNDLQLL